MSPSWRLKRWLGSPKWQILLVIDRLSISAYLIYIIYIIIIYIYIIIPKLVVALSIQEIETYRTSAMKKCRVEQPGCEELRDHAGPFEINSNALKMVGVYHENRSPNGSPKRVQPFQPLVPPSQRVPSRNPSLQPGLRHRSSDHPRIGPPGGGSAWVPSKYPKVTQLGGFNQVFSNVYLTKSGDLPWSPHGCPIFSSFNSALGLTCFGLAQMMMQLVHHARCFPRGLSKNSFLDGATIQVIQVIGSREHPENLNWNPPYLWWYKWWCPHISSRCPLNPIISGWWCNNHLEKWWSLSMGFGWHPIYEMENSEFMNMKPPTSDYYYDVDISHYP